WNIIKFQDKLYHWEEFIRDKDLFPYLQSEGSQLNENTVSTILGHYPFLTIKQIAMLSGCTISQVENDIYEISAQSHITRGLMRNGSSDEYFSHIQESQIFDINWEETPAFILEKRDALVEVIKLEQNFDFSDANYWFFLDGIPQAQFNLKKQGKSNQYVVKGFNRLIKTKRDLAEIEYQLKEWAKNNNISLSIDFTDSPYVSLTKKMISSLQKRGYIFQEGGLSLLLDRKQASGYNPFSMKKLGTWYVDKQMFGSILPAGEILHELIQLEDFNSLFVRLPSDMSSIDLTNVIYTAGINYRLGFIHKDILPVIIKAWPRHPKLNNIDHRILLLLESESQSTSQILSRIDQPRKMILARIRYLEQVRCIHRDLSQGFNPQIQIWTILNHNATYVNDKSLNDIGKIVQQILSTNPPLTINQLSRYLGLSYSEINRIKHELIKSDQIIEGYYFELYKEIQLSTPLVVNHIQELMDSHSDKDEFENFDPTQVHLIPPTDPLVILHLSNLILSNKVLEIKTRIDSSTEIWMIMLNSFPCGYFLKIPSQASLIDFDIEIRISPELIQIPVLSSVIDKISYLNQLWVDDQLYLKSINNEPMTIRKFEQLQFILNAVGIKYKM
ncbi:MAG: hypothetical protein GPJ54_02150, partial [Candidatus Heimdallarchaeota archaeon]|nr:hypothetical protein [Candidatus Heimdallarchaeota archaeon]